MSRTSLAIVCLSLALSLISRLTTVRFDPVATNPYAVARSFVTELLKDQLSVDNKLTLHQDSYTDKVSGVTHVFFRQVINGIEVAGGDISVNVKDGTVISYDDSFYHGDVPSNFFIDEPITPGPLALFCDLLQDQLVERLNPNREALESDRIFSTHRLNCERVRTRAERGSVDDDDDADPRNALLQFMVAATSNDVVKAEILGNRDQIREKMTFYLNYTTAIEMISSVPGAVSPVKAKPVYFPDGNKTMLVQAWQFEVRMRDNLCQKAVIARQAPHLILSIVGCVSDPSVPLEHLEFGQSAFQISAHEKESREII